MGDSASEIREEIAVTRERLAETAGAAGRSARVQLKVDTGLQADGTIDPALFAEDGDTCTGKNPYVRNGRIGLDISCTRKGTGGEVRQSVSGTFKADTLEAEVTTTTYLAGAGDYAMTRTVTAKRVGVCPPNTETAEKTS